MSQLTRDLDLKKDGSETPEQWAERVAALTTETRNELENMTELRDQADEKASSRKFWAVTATAAAAAIFLLFVGYFAFFVRPADKELKDAQVVAKSWKDEANRLKGENEKLSIENKKLKDQPKSDGPAASTSTPVTVAGSCASACCTATTDVVTLSRADYDVLSKRPKSCGAPKAAGMHQQQPKRGPVITETPQRAPKYVGKPGGCVYTSDGTAVLKGTKERQSNGKELARISNDQLFASSDPAIKAILAAQPNWSSDNTGHAAVCGSWSTYIASVIQEAKGQRVNNDTHRGPDPDKRN